MLGAAYHSGDLCPDVDEMKLEEDPSVSIEIEELLDCFDTLSIRDVDFHKGGFRRKETDDQLRMWFDMPGLSSWDVSISVTDNTSMIIHASGHVSTEDVDGSLNDNGRVRMYGGLLYFPENQFDLRGTHVDFKIKNGVLKVVVPKVKRTDAVKLEGRTVALPPNLKLEESTNDALLPNVKKQKLEESTLEESTDVFFINVE